MKEIYTNYIWNDDHTARYTCKITYDRQIYTGSVMYEKVEQRDGYIVTTHDMFQDFFWRCILDVLPPNERHSKKKGEKIAGKHVATVFILAGVLLFAGLAMVIGGSVYLTISQGLVM